MKEVTNNHETPEGIEGPLGYVFKNRALLEQALTHRSFANEHGVVENNEPLEFLGDAVLGFLVAERIIRKRPELKEGEATRLRASLVNTRALAEMGARLGLGQALRLGRGEEQSGGRAKPSLLADGVEALIGAVFLDGGVRAARRLVWSFLAKAIDSADPRRRSARDPKTALQEYLQGRGRALPEYRVVATRGPDHAREFEIAVVLSGEAIAFGRGSSKKRAEQNAARAALDLLLTRMQGRTSATLPAPPAS